ncbi:glycerophosphodiester phosphodiesterase [Haloferax volcanii]
MLTIGHRGCAGQYPENTIPAIEGSAPHVDLVEVDVMRCGSGELVAFHDDDLSRLTTAAGRLDETAVDDLTALRVDGTEATIPRFDQVVEAWPAGTGMNLDTRDPGLVEDALAAVEGLDERVVFSSPSREAVDIALETPTPAEVGYSFRDDASAELTWAAERGCEFVHVEHGLCILGPRGARARRRPARRRVDRRRRSDRDDPPVARRGRPHRRPMGCRRPGGVLVNPTRRPRPSTAFLYPNQSGTSHTREQHMSNYTPNNRKI